MMPDISVLLPLYNPDDVGPTIQSILNQSHKNFELLICDDASNKKASILKFKDKRIKIYKNEKNIGLGGTLNRLLTLSNHESKYFSTIEQDDVYKPDFLSECIAFLDDNEEYGLVSGISEFWDGDKVAYRFPGMIFQGYDYPHGEAMFLLNYREQIKVAQTCMVVRKNIHLQNNLTFSTKYHSLSVDWDYIMRFSLVSIMKGLNKTFVIQDRRVDRSSLTTKSDLVSKTARKLLLDFFQEFPHIINLTHYKYALATQYYRELGNYHFFDRMKLILSEIMFLDPDKKRIIKRIIKEFKKSTRILSRYLK